MALLIHVLISVNICKTYCHDFFGEPQRIRIRGKIAKDIVVRADSAKKMLLVAKIVRVCADTTNVLKASKLSWRHGKLQRS